MDAVPAINSGAALWLSTPLLAAAQLWTGHPLWAAGIWALYGISALVPQGETILAPINESPFYANFGEQYLVYSAPGARTADPRLNNKNTTITPSATLSSTTVTDDASTRSTLTTADVIVMTIPTSSRLNNHFGVLPATYAPQVTATRKSKVPSKDVHVAASPPGKTTAEPSGSRTYVPLSTEATEVKSLPLNTERLDYQDPHSYGTSNHPSRKSEALVIVMWFVVILILSGSMFLVSSVYGGLDWDTLRHVRMWIEAQYVNAQLSVADFVWSGQDPRLRVLRACTCYIILMALASRVIWYIFLSVRGMLPLTMLSAAFDSLADDISAKLHNAVAYIFTSLDMVSNCFLRLRHWITAAYRNVLSPRYFHTPLQKSSSCIDAIYQWTESGIMSVRSIPLVIRTSSPAVIARCTKKAWNDYLSPTGVYRVTPHTGPTAAMCNMMDFAVMQLRFFGQERRKTYGCYPFIIMITHNMCPEMAHEINWLLVIMLLTALSTLNAFAVWRWPREAGHTTWGPARRGLVAAFLVSVPVTILYLCFSLFTSVFLTEEGCLAVGTFALIYFNIEKLVEPWGRVLRRCRLAPRAI